ncbi:RNA polymerase sigma-70 factor [Phocaeicola sp.]|uniref:RNA polymerase sigma-70 factor n=1 Tax=Phocaeicola sp. TaxID=2773926 RepID=UPI0023BE3650|nr:RNA polymerase sigma-70 factor [Phocaeicola sp.]MDE5678416.1 RNA polymerase sigma-70 factor [Phocaeicola sp.]
MVDFNKIYKDYYKRSFSFAKSYVFEDMAAEDIASESLVALWQVMKKEKVDHPLSLLLTILRNNSLNYLKSQERKLNMMDSMSDMLIRDLNYRINCLSACDPQEIFSSEITAIIEKALSSLSTQTRQIFEMSRYEMLPVKEIAEKMELTPKAVEYHITKALKLLRIALKDYLPVYYLQFLCLGNM